MSTIDATWSGLNGTVTLETNFEWIAVVDGNAKVSAFPSKGEPETFSPIRFMACP